MQQSLQMPHLTLYSGMIDTLLLVLGYLGNHMTNNDHS